MPAVSSYVGYSLEEPWGQPRVVFGIEAREAEQLAALLEHHDCAGPVYAGLASMPGSRPQEEAEFLGVATERRRAIVPSQSQGGVAEREAAWREATWRDAVPRDQALAPPQQHYPVEPAPEQLPAAGASAAIADPAEYDEPDLLDDEGPDDAELDDAAPDHAHAGPVPQARDSDDDAEDDDAEVTEDPDQLDEVEQGPGLWRRPGRPARGRALTKQKRSGGAARGGGTGRPG
jgi:hypothetical protein